MARSGTWFRMRLTVERLRYDRSRSSDVMTEVAIGQVRKLAADLAQSKISLDMNHVCNMADWALELEKALNDSLCDAARCRECAPARAVLAKRPGREAK